MTFAYTLTVSVRSLIFIPIYKFKQTYSGFERVVASSQMDLSHCNIPTKHTRNLNPLKPLLHTTRQVAMCKQQTNKKPAAKNSFNLFMFYAMFATHQYMLHATSA